MKINGHEETVSHMVSFYIAYKQLCKNEDKWTRRDSLPHGFILHCL